MSQTNVRPERLFFLIKPIVLPYSCASCTRRHSRCLSSLIALFVSPLTPQHCYSSSFSNVIRQLMYLFLCDELQ